MRVRARPILLVQRRSHVLLLLLVNGFVGLNTRLHGRVPAQVCQVRAEGQVEAVLVAEGIKDQLIVCMESRVVGGGGGGGVSLSGRRILKLLLLLVMTLVAKVLKRVAVLPVGAALGLIVSRFLHHGDRVGPTVLGYLASSCDEVSFLDLHEGIGDFILLVRLDLDDLLAGKGIVVSRDGASSLPRHKRGCL